MDKKRHFIPALLLVFALMPPAFAQRTRLKPGMNLFSPQEDVQLGRQVAQDAEKKLHMLNDRRVDDYLNRLGKKLAAHAPGEKYPYQFRCVNDSSINAFALPGGFLFINRGTIEAADNEAELAGVIGHEIGHVALRHGTHQATKSYLTQAPLSFLGSIFGGSSVAGVLAKIGTGFTANSILLKYSRDDERQADLMGAQILYDSSYDPHFMETFFEKLSEKGRGSDFFSSHPNPEARIQNIDAEIGRLGPVPAHTVNDTREFRSVRNYLKTLRPAPKAGSNENGETGASRGGRPPAPSTRFQNYANGAVRLRHPDNWRSYGDDKSFTLAPDGGIVGSGKNSAVAYGVTMAIFVPPAGDHPLTLQEATDQLVARLQGTNSGMRLVLNQRQTSVSGERAMSKVFSNESPLGGRETDWLVTVARAEGLVYFVFVAPEQEFATYQPVFRQILNSVRFRVD